MLPVIIVLTGIRQKSSLLRDDFEPVIVQIIDKVNSHGFIFKADTAHLFMQGMSGGKIIHLKSKMKFVVAQIVGFFSVFKPRQFQLMRHFAIAKKDDNKTSVRRVYTPDFRQLQGIFVKGDALFQTEHIEIIVGESKFHIFAPS
jgi:hypothetical protein